MRVLHRSHRLFISLFLYSELSIIFILGLTLGKPLAKVQRNGLHAQFRKKQQALQGSRQKVIQRSTD
jgi:hypothetical protein